MSPLELFRRNQKVTMTFLILLAMFAFVVLPTVSTYMQQNQPGMSDPVVAEFNGVSLTSSRVTGFTQKHYATVQFLRKLAEETIRRGGMPQVPGFSLDQRTNQIQSVGINGAPSDDMSIITMQFAAQAQAEGFELDDFALEQWLKEFTNQKLSEREIFALLRRETNNQMGQYQLYDILRKQLLASICIRGADVTVSQGQFPLQSPLDHWKNFLKLNQKATVNAYGLDVNDFIEQTNENPSEPKVIATYEAGKDFYPSDQSPEPGFRQRQRVSFENLMGDLQSFRDAEVAKLSEDEIKAEYEKRLAGGAFQMPAEATIEPQIVIDPESSPETDSTQPPAEEPPAEEPPAEETPAEETPAEETPAEETPAEETPAEETPAEETPAEEDQSSLNVNDGGVQLVALQSDVPTEQASAEETAPSDEPPKTETEEAASVGAGADESTGGTDQEEKPAADPSESAAPKIRPFEEVKDLVAQSMVEDKARVARDEAIAKARSVMKKYFSTYSMYESSSDPKAVAPERPNLQTLADELGLTYRPVRTYDPATLGNEPIATSLLEETALSQQGVPFAALMFGVEGQVNKQPLFRPVVTVDLQSGRTFLAWKTEENEAYLPELEEVRDDVVNAIRLQEARELAMAAAETLAKEADDGSTTLEDLVSEDRKNFFFKDIGPFSWLNMVGFGSVSIGNVEELDDVGEEFMKAVFQAKENQHVVAPNTPQTVYYVVKRTSLQPSTVDLRSIFSQQSERIMSMFMSDGSAAKVQGGYFEAINDKTDFNRMEMPE